MKVIARIQTPHLNIRRNINALLVDVGQHHPQALVYPLTVASKSSSKSRQAAAVLIMDRMREHSAVIINQVRYEIVLRFPPFRNAHVYLEGAVGKP